MTAIDVFWINLILIGIVGFLLFFFGGDDVADRFISAVGTILTMFYLSAIGWSIFMIVHFVIKYW